jgi:glutamate-1-semialdehyde aminotransferase
MEGAELTLDQKWQEYVHAVRKRCKEVGAVFIIDEIITGFRVPKWTLSNLWSLDPDIILLGKGIANGWPLSVLAGKSSLMDSTEYFISSTFSGEATSLAACMATIHEIKNRNFEDLLFYGQRLQDKLNDLSSEVRFEGYGVRAMLNTTNPTTALFMQECCKAGILFGKAHFFHFGHLEQNIEAMVMGTAEGVMDQISKGLVKLEGEAPREVFKRT